MTDTRKTAAELLAMGEQLRRQGKFVPQVHGERDIRFWVKEQIPFVKSEQFKEDEWL